MKIKRISYKKSKPAHSDLISVEQYPSFDRLPANGTFRHPVSAHLAGAVAAQENHVLQPKEQWLGVL